MIKPVGQRVLFGVESKKMNQKQNGSGFAVSSSVKTKGDIAFGRALTTAQRKEFGSLVSQMFKKLGIDNNLMIIHAPSFPPEFSKTLSDFVDKGVGSSCGKSFEKLTSFAKDLFGSSGIQLGPEPILRRGNFSPYSHGSFSMGEYLISPVKLLEDNLVSESTLKTFSKESAKTDEGIINAEYGRFFETFSKILDEAYENFKKLDSNSPLKKEFQNYTELPQIKPWLEKDSIFFNAFSKENNTEDIYRWPELDKNLNVYLADSSNPKYSEALDRLNSIKEKYADGIEKFKFQQFLIHRQKLETKASASKMGQKIIGDIKIGNGINDIWAFPKAFLADLEKNIRTTVGCSEQINWGVDALNPASKEAQDFLELKMDNMFLYQDGARLDAVFGYVAPFLKTIQIADGNKEVLSNRVVQQGDALLQAVNRSVLKNNIDKNFVFGENLVDSRQSYPTGKILTEIGIPQLTPYTPTYIQSDSTNWIIERSHDNPTIISMENGNREKIREKFAKEYAGFNNPPKGVKFNKEFMYLDAFGIKQAHNYPYSQSTSWLTRLPKDWERLYYSNLLEKKGYNMAEILLDAAERKGITDASHPLYDEVLLNKLKEYNKTFLEQGPMTAEEAEIAEKAERAQEAKPKNLFAKIGAGILAAGGAVAVGVASLSKGKSQPQVALQVSRFSFYHQPNKDKKSTVWDSVKST